MKIQQLNEFIDNAKGGALISGLFKPKYKQRLEFLEEHWTVPPGVPFSTKGRAWLVEQFRAYEGFKAWPINSEYLCGECASLVDEVIDHPLEVTHTRTEEHRIAHGGCLGLSSENIYYHLFDADRRSGKTSTMMAYMGSSLYLDKNVRIRFTASSKEHSLEIADKNFFQAIERNPKLNASFITIAKTNGDVSHSRRKNEVSFGSASEAAALGGGFENLFFDECKKIRLKIVAALAPTINENYGLMCTGLTCKYKIRGGRINYTDPNFNWVCPMCNTAVLIPWNARMFFSSNAKILQGDVEYDWYPILVDSILQSPFKHAHILKEDDASNLNPDYNKEAKIASIELFGRIPGAEHYVNAEFGNENAEVGATVFDATDRVALFAKNLANNPNKYPCFFYLDLARKVDKVSLLGFADASAAKDWGYLRNIHLDLWHPGKDAIISSVQAEGRALDADKLVNIVWRILEDYPNFIGCWIDVRGHEWAKDVYTKLRKLSSKFFMFEGRDTERDAGWGIFYDRAKSRLLDLIPHPRYDMEFNEAVWHRTNRKLVVREKHTGKSASSRDKFHLELTESVATAHYISTIIKDTPKSLVEQQRIFDEAIRAKKGKHNFEREIRERAEKRRGRLGLNDF